MILNLKCIVKSLWIPCENQDVCRAASSQCPRGKCLQGILQVFEGRAGKPDSPLHSVMTKKKKKNQ